MQTRVRVIPYEVCTHGAEAGDVLF